MTWGTRRARRARVGGALSAAALALAGLATASDAGARNNSIAYVVPKHRQAIALVRPDGSHRRRVTSGKSYDSNPAWDRRHRLLVFDRERVSRGGYIGHSFIYTIRPNGSHLRRVPHTRDATEPALSPNGGRILFSDTCPRTNDRSAIFSIRRDGTRRRRVSRCGFDVAEPDWSPNGHAVVFSSDHGVEVVQADGRHQHVLASDGDEPQWSPNGKRIVYSQWRNVTPDEPVRDIFVMNRDGSDRHDITSSRPAALCEPAADCVREDSSPDWAPNGGRIVFAEQRDDSEEHVIEHGLYTVKPDGTSARHVTKHGSLPAWR